MPQLAKDGPAPPPACTPPAQLVCIPNAQNVNVCQCATASTPSPPVKLCTVAMVYNRDNPTGVYIGPLENGCDQAGLEIALAVLLAKILTGPPLP